MEKETYINYTQANQTLTECEKKTYIAMRNNLNKFYVPQTSNEQIKTYLFESMKHDLLLKETKLKMMFNSFTNYHNVNQIIHKLKKREIKTDMEVVTQIKKVKNTHSKFGFDKICAPWKFIMEKLAQQTKMVLNRTTENIKYLDVGCGYGNKTMSFSKNMDIPLKNVYGTDIENWGPYEQTEIKHNFTFEFLKNGIIPFENNKFDIVTCFLMLHHVENLTDLIDEIRRVLKPNGILVVIEHDNHDDFDNMMLDILHFLFASIVDDNPDYLQNPVFSRYFNKNEWDCIFHEQRFELVKTNYLFTTISQDVRYDNIYYAVYEPK